MNLDQRLRDHLDHQGRRVSVRPVGAGSVAVRARKRSARRRAGAGLATATCVAIAALGAASLRDDDPTDIHATAAATATPTAVSPSSTTDSTHPADPGPVGHSPPAEPALEPTDRPAPAPTPVDALPPSASAEADRRVAHVQELATLGDTTMAAVATLEGSSAETLLLSDTDHNSRWQERPGPLASEKIIGLDSRGERVAVLNAPKGDPANQAADPGSASITFADAEGTWTTVPVELAVEAPHPATFWRTVVNQIALGPDGTMLFGSAILDIDVQALAPILADPAYVPQYGRADGRLTELVVVDDSTGAEVQVVNLAEAGLDEATLDFLGQGADRPMIWLVGDDGSARTLDHDLGNAVYQSHFVEGLSDGWITVGGSAGGPLQVFRSDDGLTWQRGPDTLGSSVVEPLVELSGRLFLAGTNAAGHPGLWSSEDGGLTWSATDLNVPAVQAGSITAGGGSSGMALVIELTGEGEAGSENTVEHLLASSTDGRNWVVEPLSARPEVNALGPVRVDALTVTDGEPVLALAPLDESGARGAVIVVSLGPSS